MSVQVRALAAADGAALSAAFARIGSERSKPPALFARYLREQDEGRRVGCVAFVDDDVAGYVTLAWESSYQPLRDQRLPEVQDLNVLPSFRGRGIGSMLMDEAERVASSRAGAVGVAVGLHPGYNVAQRMYVRRGYVPDGRGVTSRGVFVREGDPVVLDDHLVLHLVKVLHGGTGA